ncbi:MAG: hypothetical protein IJB19_01320 [Clostridia bacterium]|nr:hypothetical protein [Clostridia bacterium]
MKRVILYILAAVRVAAPLLHAVAVGYDSVGMFLWDLFCAAAFAFVCSVVADLLRRMDDMEYSADEMHARASEQKRRIEALEQNKGKE